MLGIAHQAPGDGPADQGSRQALRDGSGPAFAGQLARQASRVCAVEDFAVLIGIALLVAAQQAAEVVLPLLRLPVDPAVRKEVLVLFAGGSGDASGDAAGGPVGADGLDVDRADVPEGAAASGGAHQGPGGGGILRAGYLGVDEAYAGKGHSDRGFGKEPRAGYLGAVLCHPEVRDFIPAVCAVLKGPPGVKGRKLRVFNGREFV